MERNDTAISIPPPAEIHREIGRLIRRTRCLRQLLRLSKKIREEQGEDVRGDGVPESEVTNER